MTLVLTINGPGTIWAMADGRLSLRGKAVRDDATKLMFLDTVDGQAVLVYAGLGATARGTQPADWMSAVLRGRKLTLEQSLGVLADAMKREFPQHLVRFERHVQPAHTIIASAFVDGEHRLYSIDMVFAPDRKRYSFGWTRFALKVLPNGKYVTPQLAWTGSGRTVLDRDKAWLRCLRRLVKAHDRERLSAHKVADHLASLNYQVHLRMPDQSVGPNCMVAWRNTRDGARRGGGAHCYYTADKREPDSPGLPHIADGFDMHAITSVMMPHFRTSLSAALEAGHAPDIDMELVNAELAKLPEQPDERLR
jgi:hypothetical protein